MRVLIVRLGAFGDIIHTLPLAADLHAADCKVGWLCEERWSCLVRGNPAIDHVHGLPRSVLKGGTGTTIWSRYGMLRQIITAVRADRYDAVIDAQGLAKSALLALCARSKLRVGHRPPRSRELSWLVSRTWSTPGAEHVIDQQRALGVPLLHGREPHGPWHFPLPAWREETLRAEAWMREHGLTQPWMLNVGAGWPTKVWPRERQIEFAQLAADARRRVVLMWGSHDERVLAEAIAEAVPSVILAPPTTLPELAGFLRQAGAFVSGDTGPLHMALAVGTPAIGLFGPVPATRNGPKGRGYRTFQAPGAAWERKDVSKVDMGHITAAEVVAAVQAVMDERG